MPAGEAAARSNLLKIGEASRRTGVTLRTVRYYQSLGLLGEPVGAQSRVRMYPERVCHRIALIRDLRRLDVPLGRIRTLLAARHRAPSGAEGSAELARTLTEKLAEIEERLADYRAMHEGAHRGGPRLPPDLPPLPPGALDGGLRGVRSRPLR